MSFLLFRSVLRQFSLSLPPFHAHTHIHTQERDHNMSLMNVVTDYLLWMATSCLIVCFMLPRCRWLYSSHDHRVYLILSCLVMRFKKKQDKKQKGSLAVNLKTHWENASYLGFFKRAFSVFTWTGQPQPAQHVGPESERVALWSPPALGAQWWRVSHLRVIVPIFLLHSCLLCQLCIHSCVLCQLCIHSCLLCQLCILSGDERTGNASL